MSDARLFHFPAIFPSDRFCGPLAGFNLSCFFSYFLFAFEEGFYSDNALKGMRKREKGRYSIISLPFDGRERERQAIKRRKFRTDGRTLQPFCSKERQQKQLFRTVTAESAANQIRAKES